MARKLLAIAALCAGLPCTPVLADGGTYGPAIAAFEAQAGQAAPQNREKLIRCAAFWLRWKNDGAASDDASQLPPSLSAATADQRYQAIMKRSFALVDMANPQEVASADTAFREAYRDAGFALAMWSLEPDVTDFFEQLGRCG